MVALHRVGNHLQHNMETDEKASSTMPKNLTEEYGFLFGISRRGVLATATMVTSVAVGLAACGSQHSQFAETGIPGLDLSQIDPRIRPQDNLFRYVNGKWLDNAQIPRDLIGIAPYRQLREDTLVRLREIIEGITATSGDEYKVKAFYDSALNTQAIEDKGLSILQPLWKLVDTASSKNELIHVVGQLSRDYYFGFPIDFGIGIDEKRSSRYVYYSSGGGLGLSRKYLVEPRYHQLRNDYITYLRTIYHHAGFPDPLGLAHRVRQLEEGIARNILPEEQQRDADKLYNIYSLASFQQITPGLSLSHLIEGERLDPHKLERIIVDNPNYYTAFAHIWESQDLDFLKLWIKASLVRDNTNFLPLRFRDADFVFYSKKIQGVIQRPPHWKLAVHAVSGSFPDTLGKLYVQKYFPAEARDQIHNLIDNLKIAYRASFEQSWLSPATKKAAIAKLDAISTKKVGYPDQWKSYDDIVIGSDFYHNNLNISRWYTKQGLAKFDKPVDKSEWDIPVYTVNAFYDAVSNEIVFPAGYLQSPYFDYRADPAVNYGAIGSTIGHEISHAFDDEGSQFDGQGNLHNWWTTQDREHFKKLTHNLIDLYNAFVPAGLPPKDHINGVVSAGENAADLNGLAIAIRALRAHYNNGDIRGAVSKKTLQTVFYSYARSEREKTRPEALAAQIASDPHSPGEARVNLVVKNIDDFYVAFDVKPGDKEYLPPEKRIRFW